MQRYVRIITADGLVAYIDATAIIAIREAPEESFTGAGGQTTVIPKRTIVDYRTGDGGTFGGSNCVLSSLPAGEIYAQMRAAQKAIEQEGYGDGETD